MKKIFTLAAFALALTNAQADVAINSTNFPDENFLWEMEHNADADGDGYLSDEEIAAVNDYYLSLNDVVNFKGIEYFYDGLKHFLMGGLNSPDPYTVTNLDISKFKVLETIEIGAYPYFTSIDFSKNMTLRSILIHDLQRLTTIQVPAKLESLTINYAPNITSLDLTPCKNNLIQLNLWCGGVKELDLSNYKALTDISVAGSGVEERYPLTSLNVSGCDNLGNVSLDATTIETVTMKDLESLHDLHVSNNEIKTFTVENCPLLAGIECNENDLSSLNIKKCPVLWVLRADDNRMKELIIDESPGLTLLEAANNQLMWLDMSKLEKDVSTEEAEFRVDDQHPAVQAVKISPTETGLLVHSRFDVSRVLNLRAKGIAQTPRETTVDGIRYFVFYDDGPDTPNLVGSDCFYEYETKWPYPWMEENSKDNNLPVTLNVYSWTKHQAFLKLSENHVTGKYGEPAPTAPTVTRSQDYDGKITFSSSNENVVKVDAETGVLTVIGAGTATITVSGAETDYRLAPTTSYTVFIEKATPVIAFPAAEINAVYGETVPLNQLTVTWYEGTVTYASADEQKATVTAEGVVTTKGAGDVVIKGIAPETNNFKRGEVTYVLHIDKARPTFAFEKDGLTAVLGQPVPENKLAVGLYDGDIIYTSSCDSIATVDSLGVVTANVPGEVVITATGAETDNCYATGTDSYTLTITDSSSVNGLAADADKNREWYDLQGRRVCPNTARKGIYIVGEKKTVRK